MSDINSNDWVTYEESGTLERTIHFKDFFSKRGRGFSRKNCPRTILPQYQIIIALIDDTRELANIQGGDFIGESDEEILYVICDDATEAAQLLALNFLLGGGEKHYICSELISLLELM